MRNNYKIIDTHCHIYPDKIADKAAQSTADFYHMSRNHDGTLGRLVELSKSAGVDHIVVQSVATAPKQVESINRYVADAACASGGYITGLGALHPDSGRLDDDIALIRELGLKGVKLHADIQQIAINDPRCYKMYERLEGVLPVLMHTGDKRYDFSNPGRLVPVLKDFPHLTVIGAHFGGWSVWEEAADKLTAFENLYVDTSSTFGFTSVDFVGRLLPRYDIDRILFGVDYPMWTPNSEIESLLKLKLKEEEYQKIFYKNASTLYGILL